MTTAMRMSVLASAALIALGGSALGQQAPQSPNMTFFLASNGPGKGGDLRGLAGADAHCQNLARLAGAGTKTSGVYSSALATLPPNRPMPPYTAPPAIKTRPSLSRVAVWISRGTVMLPVA